MLVRLFAVPLFLFMLSCSVKDVKESKFQFVDVVMDKCTKEDSALFNKFKKEELIKVRIHVLSDKEILSYLERDKFNVDADLLILSDFEDMLQVKKRGFLHPYNSLEIDERIDPIYRSKSKKWVALSKTPLVMAFNSTVLKKDTIKNYYDLIHPKWQSQIQLSKKETGTMQAFERNIRLLMKQKADTFLLRFWSQSNLPLKEDAFSCLKSLDRNQSKLSLVKLSEYVPYLKKNRRTSVKIIFPNQRKKGCYLSVTTSGIYRYAKNPLQAQRLMEFLTSSRAQYAFSSSRYEFPVLNGTNVAYELRKYEKFRARFYHRKTS